MKIDTHIHSTFSDGTLTPKEIVKEAKNKKLDLIAITDHNTFGAINEFSYYVNKYKQNAIAGIEISTIYKKEEVHLLAYFPINTSFFYPQYKKILKLNENYKNSKKYQIEKMIQNIQKEYNVSVDDFYKFIKTIKKDENYNRVHISNYLIYKGISKTLKESFDKFLCEESKYYVPKKQTDLLDAIKIVKESGGLPSLAHIGQYSFTNEDLCELLNDVSKITNEFGVELFHHDHDSEKIKNILEVTNFISKNTNLKIFFTAGSDCHGKNKINEIGKPYNFKLNNNQEKLYEKVSNDFIELLQEKNILKINEKNIQNER